MPRYSNFRHTPYDGSEPLFRIGLRPYLLENWLEFDACYHDQMSEKERLNQSIPDMVFCAEEDTETAQAEVLSLVHHYLQNHNPELIRDVAHVSPDLLKAAMMVQEDLVLLRKAQTAGDW